MKRALQLFAAGLLFVAGHTATAQMLPVVVVTGQVTDPNGPVANHPILVTIAPTPGTVGGGSPITRTLMTSGAGFYSDSIPSPGIMGTITVGTLNCNGTTLVNTMAFTPNNGPAFTFTSNFTLCANSGPNPLTCTANWILDTNQTTPGVVNIINACATTVTGPATNVVTNYLWDFGDGNSATGAYPSNFYTTPGKYQICVTMGSVATSINATCTAQFCDSIEVDANGYLVYKGQAGFQLNIINANQVSLTEVNTAPLYAYPNPVAAGDRIQWEGPVQSVTATSADGRVLVQNHAEPSLSTAGWAPGLYFLTLHTPQGSTTQRVVLR